ncbi:MAG: sugar ABC transporter ATP-binding protein [Acidobacteria bacterium]|nr:sugar ABC transporter ATP-binding protein [Acidobacteriota bacterium]
MTVLEARAVSVRYPGTLALDGVTFRLRAGEVRALIGENGAGKSTLVKVLAGIVRPTSGTLLVDGRPVSLGSVREADALGIGVIHQELNLCPNLSVAENIYLARELARGGLLDRRRQERGAHELLERLEHPIPPGAIVGELGLGQQQIVEIAKALARDVRVLMMDEPTSALSAAEARVLFRIIRDLAARGVAILYISHRLEELLTIADAVTVLRDGRLAAEAATADVDRRWIVEQMTGRTDGTFETATEARAGDKLVRVDGLSAVADSGRALVRNVTVRLAAGEIVGLYGLMGAGRTELLECLMGLRAVSAGSVTLGGRRIDRLDAAGRIAAGMAMVPEDRQALGLTQSMSVAANITLASIGRFARFGWLRRGAEMGAAEDMAAQLRIKSAGLGRPVGSLSGGNQQKVVIAKCLLTGPRVLLLDEPTRGVDVGAKAEIHAIVRRLAERGIGILVASSELEEVRAVAHRVVVMARGAVTAEFAAVDASDDALAAAATGVEGSAAA